MRWIDVAVFIAAPYLCLQGPHRGKGKGIMLGLGIRSASEVRLVAC